MSLFNSFSPRARRAVFWANSRALQEDASEITAEHILYGVLQEDPQLFALLVPESPQLASQIDRELSRKWRSLKTSCPNRGIAIVRTCKRDCSCSCKRKGEA